jgi:hypothetical protein
MIAQRHRLQVELSNLVSKENGLLLAAAVHIVRVHRVVADNGHVLPVVELLDGRVLPPNRVQRRLLRLQGMHIIYSRCMHV